MKVFLYFLAEDIICLARIWSQCCQVM